MRTFLPRRRVTPDNLLNAQLSPVAILEKLMRNRVIRSVVTCLATVALTTSGAATATASVADPFGNALGSLQLPTGNGDQLVWQGPIEGDVNHHARQVVRLGNGVTATITLDVPSRTISVSADNGAYLKFDLNSLRAHVGANRDGQAIAPLANSCDVATGIAGIAHSALWGAALGGPAGVAAGVAVGAFWWGVSQGC